MAVDGRDPDMSRLPADSGSAVGSSSVALRYGVKALITDGRRVLLVKETHRDGDPFWTLPGGGIRSDEGCRDALRRELEEELGCVAAVGDPVGTCRYRHRSDALVTNYTVLSTDLDSRPEPNGQEGILDVTWARPGSPPDAVLPEFGSRLEAFCEALPDRSVEPVQRNEGRRHPVVRRSGSASLDRLSSRRSPIAVAVPESDLHTDWIRWKIELP